MASRCLETRSDKDAGEVFVVRTAVKNRPELHKDCKDKNGIKVLDP